MAPDNGATPPYTIDISPAAWRQLASFPRETYLVVQERLRALAVLATEGRLPVPHSAQGGGKAASATFIVGDFAARYEADARARAVRLVAVENRMRTGSHGAKQERLFE